MKHTVKIKFMMKRVFLLMVLFSILGLVKTYAGWYQCYNYKGTVGNYPITLSIQITEGFFGEKDKEIFAINGVYKYDHYNNPIQLEGVLNLKNNKIQLFEKFNDAQTATLEFNFSENIVTGTWTSLQNQKTLPLNLEYVSKLMDTSDADVFENIEILQLNALKDYYFMGVYSKKEAASVRANMQKLKIMNKHDNSVFQIIDFKDLEYNVGNVITLIYQNIEVNNLSENKITVWCDVGRMGGVFTIQFDNLKNKFISDYDLTIDGPN
ncbi:hypothetical protein Celal_4029 [Cellulophaga algicola DSM 14237]|uniref:Uncharacterized protein n=2 Tax=Cellulophaga TaxID=104264 RepID=E6XDT5_CELAD|nr:hypothetical protein Celal_4029 [Cellulophaga algicola DSM 14237]